MKKRTNIVAASMVVVLGLAGCQNKGDGPSDDFGGSDDDCGSYDDGCRDQNDGGRGHRSDEGNNCEHF